jgi:hypothetical protein
MAADGALFALADPTDLRAPRRIKRLMQRTTVLKQSEGEGRSMTPVEVVGLQAQLTVPSRLQPDLVDLWIEVNWPQRTQLWDVEFGAAAAAVSGDSAPFGALSLERLSQHRGWIVARRVPRDCDARFAVETCVRAVVDTANQRCGCLDGAVAAPQPHAHWIVRTLAVLGSLSAVFSNHAQ